MVYRRYRLKDFPSKSLLIATDSSGFYYIVSKKLAEFYGRENIFASLEELQLVIGYEIEPISIPVDIKDLEDTYEK